MRRPSKADRLESIADAALQSFSQRGFRLTQVADVARLAGVAPGTIYLFAESKEALFWLAFARSLDRPLENVPCEVPSINEIRSMFGRTADSIDLALALKGPDSSLPSLSAVILDYWTAIENAASAIKLVERCAEDWPDLAHAFYEGLRANALGNLTEYLIRAAKAGLCREAPDPSLAARFIVESIAWFAMHRRGDYDGRHFTSDSARNATLDALLHAYGPLHREES